MEEFKTSPISITWLAICMDGMIGVTSQSPITQASTFYPAEDYHQNYFNQNGQEPYCQIVIKPKMDKFLKAFKDKLN